MSNQLTLFPYTEQLPPVFYYPDFLEQDNADTLYAHCKQLDWQQNQIRMLGKWIDLPRRECMYGDSTSYRYLYSGSVELKAHLWTSYLEMNRKLIQVGGWCNS